MREIPILFSGPMVRAILEGRKTVTRRPLKPQPEPIEDLWRWRGLVWTARDPAPRLPLRDCPLGAVGDVLWVREPHRDWALSGAGEPWRIEYRADGAHRDLRRCPDAEHVSCAPRWRTSIHMPKWAARLFLEVTDIRVKRLQDIDEAGSLAEGVAGTLPEDTATSARDEFRILWDRLYPGPLAWEANPWVWVVEFRRVEASHV